MSLVNNKGAEQALNEAAFMLAQSQRILGTTLSMIHHGPHITGLNAPYQVAVCVY